MELGMIGLGRLGANMVRRLVNHGHTVVGNALHRDSVDAVVPYGMVGAYSREELVEKLHTPLAGQHSLTAEVAARPAAVPPSHMRRSEQP